MILNLILILNKIIPLIIGIALLFAMIIGAIIVNFSTIRHKLRKKIPEKFTENKDELVFYRGYGHYGGYSTEQRDSKESIDKILTYFRNSTSLNKHNHVLLESKFNGVHYAFFDLDSKEMLDLFKKIYNDESYAIFISSEEHYWGILDIPYSNLNDIFFEPNWKVCNDEKYISLARSSKALHIRGLYENESRKPRLYETNGNLSQNFQLFIDKMTKYFSKEALELSVLRYKDPDLLIKFNRKRKLEQINNESTKE